MRTSLPACVLCLVAAPVLAGPDSYVCTIQSFSRLNEGGALTSDRGDPILGEEFVVDRGSGRIMGKYIASAGYETKVLDPGSIQQSFKMVASTTVGFKKVLYLQVHEFNKAERKPFLLVDASLIYAGTCK